MIFFLRKSIFHHIFLDLFSVNPKIAAWVRDLFVLNERATFYGEWAHGFFSYCAVGATSVGSIIFHYDPEMVTNIQPGKVIHGSFLEKDFTTLDPALKNGLPIEKGMLNKTCQTSMKVFKVRGAISFLFLGSEFCI